MWKTAAAALLVTVAVGAPLSQDYLSPQRPPDYELLDYLTQDVCVDSAQRPVQGDPASCKLRRNVGLGEPLPYIVTDFDRRAGISYASFSSIPVRGTDGHLKVLVVKSLEGQFTPDYTFSFSGARDAFDLIDLSHSPYVSIVRTFDGGCFDQVFSRNGRSNSIADRAGGWVLFPLQPPPTEWPPVSSEYVTTWRKQVSVRKAQCADNNASGVTFWTRPARHTFETGKVLTALRSDHFAAANLAQPDNAFERFYFTREYGMTRWESWATRAQCRRSQGANSARCKPEAPDNPLRGRCSVLTLPGQTTPGLEQWGGQDWVRMDCRDLTRFVPLRRPQLPLSPEIATGGGLLDIDYVATLRGLVR